MRPLLLSLLTLFVATALHARPLFENHPTEWKVYVGESLDLELKDLLKDEGSGPLVWAPLSPPPWLKWDLNAGRVTGTPAATDAGEVRFRLSVKEAASDAGDITQIVLQVKFKVQWNTDPVDLGTQYVGVPFERDLTPLVDNPGGDPLAFSATGLPPWLALTAKGKLSGTPRTGDLGAYSGITLTVSTPEASPVSAQAGGRVIRDPNRPPRWLEDPIQLGDLLVGQPLSGDLSPKATDPDGDPLTFKVVQGPLWIALGGDGQLSGSPPQLGAFTALVEVSDGRATATAALMGNVVPLNQPPKIDPEALTFIVKERDVFTVELNDPKFVHDPEGDPLRFSLSPSTSWVELTPRGRLTLRPLHPQLGSHTFNLDVTEDRPSGKTSRGRLKVTVIPAPRPPRWTQDPIRMEARVNQAFTNHLGPYVSDPDGLVPLSFQGQPPAWLRLDSSGQLSGTPGVGDAGANRIPVQVTNTAGLSASATLIVTVRGGTQIDRETIDAVGAGTEVVWLLNYTTDTDALVRGILRNLPVFYTALDRAGVHHRTIQLSANPYWYKSKPIEGDSGRPILKWSDGDVAAALADQAFNGFVVEDRGTPIWTLNCFFGLPPNPTEGCHSSEVGSSGIAGNGFLQSNVPLDAMIVSNQIDAYGSYARRTLKKGWKPKDYAAQLVQFTAPQEQDLRISVVGYKCEGGGFLNPTPAAKFLSDETEGTFYTLGCGFKYDEMLQDYAHSIIRRAALGKVQAIELTHPPLNPGTMEVRIDGQLIPPSQWAYDSGRNRVLLDWTKIDPALGVVGKVVEVKYTW